FSSNHPPTTETYTLSLHDALPILFRPVTAGGKNGKRLNVSAKLAATSETKVGSPPPQRWVRPYPDDRSPWRSQLRNKYLAVAVRSEEHTSELQSRGHLVCRLLLEK